MNYNVHSKIRLLSNLDRHSPKGRDSMVTIHCGFETEREKITIGGGGRTGSKNMQIPNFQNIFGTSSVLRKSCYL